MAFIPPLRLAGLGEQPLPSRQDSLAEENEPMITPGRASARTKARAQLRAKARARRREDTPLSAKEDVEDDDPMMGMATARMGCETARMFATVLEEEEETESSEGASSFRAQKALPHPKSPSRTQDHVDEDDTGSEDSDASEEGHGNAFGFSGAWEYPLSAAERKARVLMLLGRNEALGDCQIRRGERHAEKLRGKVRVYQKDVARLQVDGVRLRRERSDLCREAAELRSDNGDLKKKLRDVQRQLQQERAAAADVQQLQQSQQLPAEAALLLSTRSAYTAAAPVAMASVAGLPAAAWPGLPMAEAQTLAAPIWGQGASVLSTAPAGSYRTSFPSLPSFATGPTEIPRSLVSATPRCGTARGGGTRGSIASVSWASDVGQVPWVAITNRLDAAERLYGDRWCEEEYTISSAHLRRGEFICCISGSQSQACSSGGSPLLARCLRIMTSEQQEIVVGEAAAAIEFGYQAEPGNEIVGLVIQNNFIAGVKQAVLAPSRVQPNSISGPEKAMESRQGRARRSKEAVE